MNPSTHPHHHSLYPLSSLLHYGFVVHALNGTAICVAVTPTSTQLLWLSVLSPISSPFCYIIPNNANKVLFLLAKNKQPSIDPSSSPSLILLKKNFSKLLSIICD